MQLRSANVTQGAERAPNRSLFYAMGYTKEELDRPLIGVVSAHSEIVPGLSAINTFFRGLISEETPAAAPDERNYAELTPGSVVADADIECSVSESGVLSFTGTCSVYPPCDGVVESVAESDGTYAMEIRHTTSFSTVIAGLTYAYSAAGDTVYSTIPVGFTDGASAVTVSLYDGDSLIRAYSLDEDNDIVWNV